MSLFERYLALWVALCIVAGVTLGHLAPGAFHLIGRAEIAKVNLPVAALIWLTIISMLIKIDFAALREVGQHWRGIGVTLFISWAIKPFSMAALGAFFGYLFRPYLPADQISSYIAGLIILAAAPCMAMVFVWSNRTRGEPHFTLTQVALNDTIMMFAFAPIVGLLLGLSAIAVPWSTLVLSVVLYIVVPVIVAQLLRNRVLASGGRRRWAALAADCAPAFYFDGWARLQCRRPFSIDLDVWRRAVDDPGRFLDRSGGDAAALGWRRIDLFDAPRGGRAGGLVWRLSERQVRKLGATFAILGDGRTVQRATDER